MQFGGRTRHFLPFWCTICSDRYVLGLLKGVKIPFINNELPHQRKIPSELHMSEEEMVFVDNHLSELLAEGFIEKLDHMLPNGWVSNIFLVPKRQGGFRMILNLKELNKFVKYTKFKMDHVDKVISLLRPSDFMGSLDLTSAYGQVHLDNRHKNFFQFTWCGQIYCYVTLPQGFSDSPRMFVRITSPVMAYLRDRLIDILIYKDDTFLRAPTANILSENLKVTLDLFGKCGLVVNTQKSCIIPTQQMEFLGFLFDSVAYTIAVTDEKHGSLLKLITSVVNNPKTTMTIRHLTKIIGKIVAIFPACLQAKLHYRTLERYKTKRVLLHRSWSK